MGFDRRVLGRRPRRDHRRADPGRVPRVQAGTVEPDAAGACAGEVWQGLDGRTGSVASAPWVEQADGGTRTFLAIDGRP